MYIRACTLGMLSDGPGCNHACKAIIHIHTLYVLPAQETVTAEKETAYIPFYLSIFGIHTFRSSLPTCRGGSSDGYASAVDLIKGSTVLPG